MNVTPIVHSPPQVTLFLKPAFAVVACPQGLSVRVEAEPPRPPAVRKTALEGRGN